MSRRLEVLVLVEAIAHGNGARLFPKRGGQSP